MMEAFAQGIISREQVADYLRENSSELERRTID